VTGRVCSPCSHVQISTWLVAKYRQACNYPQATNGPDLLQPRHLTRDGQQILWYVTSGLWALCHQSTRRDLCPRQCNLTMVSADHIGHANSAFEGRSCSSLVHSLSHIFLLQRQAFLAQVAHKAEGSQIAEIAKMSSNSDSGESVYTIYTWNTTVPRGMREVQMLNNYFQEVQSPRLSNRRLELWIMSNTYIPMSVSQVMRTTTKRMAYAPRVMASTMKRNRR
jgi:hypothetical protein